MINPRHIEGSAISNARQAATSGALIGRSVLLADDSSVIRFIVGVALGGQGAVVYEACNGEEAIALALQIRPDIILMDMQMPLLDGLEATTQLRSFGLLSTKIIALTSANGKAESERCLSAGMNGIIEKPFSPAMLISRLLSVLDGSAKLASEVAHPEAAANDILSLPTLHKLWGGNLAYTERMLQIAVRELPDTAKKMEAALAAGDPSSISRLAHFVRPCVEGLRFSGMAAALLRLEVMAEEVLRFDELEALVKRTSTDLRRLAGQINDGISGLKYELA